jgi:hypothetical protein
LAALPEKPYREMYDEYVARHSWTFQDVWDHLEELCGEVDNRHALFREWKNDICPGTPKAPVDKPTYTMWWTKWCLFGRNRVGGISDLQLYDQYMDNLPKDLRDLCVEHIAKQKAKQKVKPTMAMLHAMLLLKLEVSDEIAARNKEMRKEAEAATVNYVKDGKGQRDGKGKGDGKGRDGKGKGEDRDGNGKGKGKGGKGGGKGKDKKDYEKQEDKVCSYCQKERHVKSECWAFKEKDMSEEQKAKSRALRSEEQAKSIAERKKSVLTCPYCKKDGHWRVSCPEWKKAPQKEKDIFIEKQKANKTGATPQKK